ncbi:MAG: hypothetical protein ACSLE5_12350 [Porticoccaceae bacterium]
MKKQEQTSLAERFLMAVFAPVVFNILLFIVLGIYFRHPRYFRKFLLRQIHWPDEVIFLALVALPAIGGFMMGVSRCATLVGHFFYTNIGQERNIIKTLAAWGSLLLVAIWSDKCYPVKQLCSVETGPKYWMSRGFTDLIYV